MNYHWPKFKQNKYYLVIYFTVSLIVLILLNLGLFISIDWKNFFHWQSSWWPLAFLPLGLILGVKVPVLIHNCVHGNLKNKKYNQVIGELAGLYIWLGMAAFEINHRLHHVYSDTNLDPHNLKNKNFAHFFFANNFGGTQPVLKQYLKYHGDNIYNKKLFKLIVFLHFTGVPFRALLWFLALGPYYFLTIFMPSYLFHMFVFAHINFVTHKTLETNKVEIYNLDSNLYYKFINYFGNGVYFHKNHHANPNLYNPQLGLKSSRFIY